MNNISRAKSLGGLYDALATLTQPVVDATDILRMQIVLVVSSLDALIHDIVHAGIIEYFEGKRPQGKNLDRNLIRLSCIKDIIAGSSAIDIIKSELSVRNSYFSFQSPEKISEAINSFSSIKIWKEIASQTMLGDSDDIQRRLSLIVDRRNKIAHEADCDPTDATSRWAITKQDTNEAIEFIEKIGIAIHNAVKI